MPILKPGRNCWRIERAERCAFLVDAAAYFSAFEATAPRARHSLMILSWDIDSRLRLNRDRPEQLAPFLNRLVANRPALHAYLLNWDFAMIYRLEREWLPAYRLGWRTHRRLHFRLDGRHPAGASQHQKVVVIDDRLAFVGGLDLTKQRWDTPSHRPDDARRTDPDGIRYPPFHDVQIMVEGPVATALGELARERWWRATAQRLAPPPADEAPSPWPPRLPADLQRVAVGIARTEPAYEGRPAVREVEQLHLDTIATARRFLYIENQYLTSQRIGEALARRIADPAGPEVVIVLPQRTSGWLEQHTMDVLRGRLLRRLQRANGHGRLRLYYPARHGLGAEQINVHGKVTIADDRLVRIGSANLSNRSMGLDSECDLAVEADDAETRAAIGRFRSRLLAEHLGYDAKSVDRAFAQRGSLIAAIESLRETGGERTLRELDGRLAPELDQLVPDAAMIDPQEPVSAERLAAQLLPAGERHSARHHLLLLGGVLILIALLAAAWQFTPLNAWLSIDRLTRMLQAIRQMPAAPLWVVGGYVVGSLLVVPVSLLIIVTLLAFGPFPGLLYTIAGILASAVVTFALGHLLGRNAIRRVAGSRLDRLSRRLARRGLITVVIVRLLPIAPFTLVNMVAGASHVRLRDFTLGTALGMAPGIIAASIMIEQVHNTLRNPRPLNLGLLALTTAALALAIVLVRRWLRRRRPPRERGG